MRLPRKWVLSLSLLAAAPGVVQAGPLDFLKPKTDATAAATAPQSNQQIANNVAAALKKARLRGYDIAIDVKNGTVVLQGKIADRQQRAAVTKIVEGIPGVENVDNRMALFAEAAPQQLPTEQAVQQAGFAGSPNGQVQPVAYRDNQAVAQDIADALSTAGLSGYDIEVRYKQGIASLIGTVKSAEQITKAEEATRGVTGVNDVLNRLTSKTGGPSLAGGPQMIPASAAVPYPGGPQQAGPGGLPQGVPPQAIPQPQLQQMMMAQAQQAAAYQQAQAQRGAYNPVPHGGSQAGGPQGQIRPVANAAPVPGPAPGYGHPHAGPSHVAYNQPNCPPYAWPSYAAHDNYAAVNYPSMYDASAWPYIGPYYPYPQVPLGWRSAQLTWDDGYWNLKFNARTDRWWWFLNPKNWHEIE